MGRPVSRIHSPTSALDFVRDKVRNHAGGYPKMKILALELSTARGSLAWLNSEEGPARANAPACRDPGREGACATRKDDIDLFERENFHFRVTARVVSDFIPNKIQRACWGMNSGNRSAHSTTDTPSPK